MTWLQKLATGQVVQLWGVEGWSWLPKQAGNSGDACGKTLNYDRPPLESAEEL